MLLCSSKRSLFECLKIAVFFVLGTALIVVVIEPRWRAASRTTNSSPVVLPPLPFDEMNRCAYLECSHASNCTTRDQKCCSYILKRLLVIVTSYFRQHRMPYVLIYGTLLGAVRNRTIIPWTRDVDFGFFNWTYLRSEPIRRDLYARGFYLFHGLGLTRICVHPNISDTTLLVTYNRRREPPAAFSDLHAYVDLYHASMNEAASQQANQSVFDVESIGSLLSPISFARNVVIDGEAYPTVDNVQEHLVHSYTKDYMREAIPDTP